MNWLMKRWYARCRKIDLQILWPICVKYSVTLDHAKAAFAVHAFEDKAWMVLGEEGVTDFIDKLEAPKATHEERSV